LILAGGEGTRLKPITEKIPKPMVEINGKPFIEYQFELLARNRITDVILCVGYLWEHIKEYFGDSYTTSSGKKLKLRYSVEPHLVGTAGAIILAKNLVNNHFFVIYGDSFLPIDYQQLGDILDKNDAVGVISVYENQDKIVNNNMQVDANGFVVDYNKQTQTQKMNGVEAGVNLFKRDLFDSLPKTIPQNQKISLEVDIYPKLIEQRQLLAYMSNKRFYDMGTFERLEIISEVLK
jgi:NDP-sugar pyrophosphorylase family protein